jgi:hypothetical protein
MNATKHGMTTRETLRELQRLKQLLQLYEQSLVVIK